MAHPFHTIGHSTRSIDEFVELLRSGHVTLVVDVRAVPRSRTNPQYNRDALPDSLAPFQIRYEHIAALGGLRRRERDVPPDVNAFWTNESFHNFADYALGDDFHRGFARLIEVGRAQRCAIMCAEAVWWQCHRRLVADALVARGVAVRHILGPDAPKPHELTDFARVESGRVRYPGLF